jgi:DNA-directed RNA polymerase-3 subunit RPC5
MSKLFVSDDEDEVPQSTTLPTFISQETENDDPVVSEIPIIFTSKPSNLEFDVLQYPGRPPVRPYTENSCILQSRTKPSTNLLEVDVPIETQKFFDINKSDEWGGVSKQTLSGVLCALEGYYAARVENGEIIVCQLDRVAQLRPSLSYIDKEIAAKREMNRLDYSNNAPQRETVQVVQMSVKGTNDNTPRLGGALMARKKVEEEEFTVLQWNDLTKEETAKIREDAFTTDKKDVLKSTVTEDEYLEMLVKETIMEN